MSNLFKMINVKDHEDGSFTIEWDENDPQESIFNDWTKEDFIEFFRWCAKRENAKESKKNLKKITTTPKAKVKTSTKGTTSTSKRRTKKPSELKVMNSRKIELFPWIQTFPFIC